MVEGEGKATDGGILTSRGLKRMVKEASDRLVIIMNGPKYDDVLSPYVLLRRIYQQLTNIMLSLDKPLLDVCVLMRPQFCQVAAGTEHSLSDTFEFESLDMEEDRSSVHISARSSLSLGRYQRVGIGGTFDHLHAGHKLMLSVAAMLTRGTLLCGVTAPGGRMLEGKHYKERIESWEERVQRVEEFLDEFCPRTVRVEIIQLHDPFGPTISDATLEALVVSPETYTGGEASTAYWGGEGATVLTQFVFVYA